MTPEEEQNIKEIIERVNRSGKSIEEVYEEVCKTLGTIADLIADAFSEVFDKIAEFNFSFEPYMIFELQHPKKKPRGSIRRARKRGKCR